MDKKIKTKLSKKLIKRKNASTKPVVCWECGKSSHTRNQCKLRRKISEFNIPKEEK